MKHAFKALTFVTALFLAGATVPAMAATSGNEFASQTKTIDFYYQSFETYYSCSGAEDGVRSLLKTLGARNIESTCNGGLSFGFVDVKASFDVATAGDAYASWQTVKIRTNGGCDFDKQLLALVLPAFSTDNVSIRESCFAGQQGLEGTLSVLK
jgi:hypothetical protein